MSALENIFRYHQSSKHGYNSFAPGPGYLDWYSQPDPFRRYEGAEVIPLKKISPTKRPFFSEALQPSTIAVSPLTFESISQLFFESVTLIQPQHKGGAFKGTAKDLVTKQGEVDGPPC